MNILWSEQEKNNVESKAGDFDVLWDCGDDAQATWKLGEGPSKPFDQLQRICYMQGFRKADRDVDRGRKIGRGGGRTQKRLRWMVREAL
jgi:hypothetical protein